MLPVLLLLQLLQMLLLLLLLLLLVVLLLLLPLLLLLLLLLLQVTNHLTMEMFVDRLSDALLRISGKCGGLKASSRDGYIPTCSFFGRPSWARSAEILKASIGRLCPCRY